MAKQNKSKIISIITWVIVLLLLVGAIGAIIHFTGINKDDITDIVKPVFRVEYDGKVYKADTENVIDLPQSGQARFEVKGTNKYTVIIAPNVTAETDFDYTVNGKTYPYGGEKDLSFAFDLKKYDSAFTLSADNDYSLESVLSKIWGVDDISVNEHDNFPLYRIVVTSSNGETIEMLFGSRVDGVIISPDKIIF